MLTFKPCVPGAAGGSGLENQAAYRCSNLLKIQRDDPHNQNSAVTVAQVSTVLHVRAAP
jgi:hypothetical protein